MDHGPYRHAYGKQECQYIEYLIGRNRIGDKYLDYVYIYDGKCDKKHGLQYIHNTKLSEFTGFFTLRRYGFKAHRHIDTACKEQFDP